MAIKQKLAKGFNKVLGKLGARIVSSKEFDDRYIKATFSEEPIPDSAKEILKKDNKRLNYLTAEYKKLDIAALNHSFWDEKNLKTDEFDLQYFRGDNLYLWQYRSVGSSAHLKYLLYTYYLQGNDPLNLLEKLKEDKLFGVYLFDFNRRFNVSRDMLDSISEIYFLDKYLSISQKTNFSFVDIGAGYGRLAHRMMNVYGERIDNYFCVDAIPESTFLCEFYLKFRNVSEKAVSVPIYDIEKRMSENKIDLAINIHSFTECTFEAIKWWLELVRKNNVKNLFIIPNPNEENKLLSVENDGKRIDFMPLIEKLGYELKVYEPKIKDSSLQEVMHHLPVYYYLFELKA